MYLNMDFNLWPWHLTSAWTWFLHTTLHSSCSSLPFSILPWSTNYCFGQLLRADSKTFVHFNLDIGTVLCALRFLMPIIFAKLIVVRHITKLDRYGHLKRIRIKRWPPSGISAYRRGQNNIYQSLDNATNAFVILWFFFNANFSWVVQCLLSTELW